jgi:Fe-S-cluster containining protein
MLPKRLGPLDSSRWLSLHGTEVGDQLEFECRCTKLTPAGRCSIYETRPVVCQVYVAGGPECLATIRRRRTPEQAKQILGG